MDQKLSKKIQLLTLADYDVYEFRLLVHYAFLRGSWQRVADIARDTNISVGHTSDTRAGLIADGTLIPVRDQVAGKQAFMVDWQRVAQRARSRGAFRGTLMHVLS